MEDARCRFAERGYVVIEDFLPPTVLAALRREVHASLQMPAVTGCERPHNRLVPLRWNDAAVHLVLEHPERRRRIAASIGAEDLRWISGYVSVKEAHTPPLWWHQDWWCWDHPVSVRSVAADGRAVRLRSCRAARHRKPSMSTNASSTARISSSERCPT